MRGVTSRASHCSSPGCTNILPSLPKPISGSKSSKWRRHYRKIASDEIRLVRVQPGAPGDIISCELFSVKLFKSPSPQEWGRDDQGGGIPPKNSATEFLWRALSYVWGSATSNESSWHRMKQLFKDNDSPQIYLNGDKMSIQPNLYDCLIWLRRHDYSAPMWIDALCIDQLDTLEKSEQVQKMGDIYRSAGETVMCIPPLFSTEQYQQRLRNEATLSDIFQKQESITEERMRVVLFDLITQPETQLLYEAVANMLKDYLPTSYWNRTWTVQECVLSPNLTLLSGVLILSWERLLELRRVAMSAFLNSAMGASNRRSSAAEVAPDVGRKFRDLAAISVDIRYRLRRQERDRSLEHVLREICPRLWCTDPRDQIYSMLGMVQTSSTPNLDIRTDYSRCTECVWREATVLMIRETNTLNILSLCGSYSDTSKRKDQIPSWLPYWSELPASTDHQDRYEFCKGSIAQYTLAADGKSLGATGFIMGTVVGHAALSDIKDYTETEVKRELSRINKFLSTGPIEEEDRVRLFEDLANLAIESHARDSEDIATVIRKICVHYATSRSGDITEPDTRQGAAYTSLAMAIWQGYPLVIEREGVRWKFAIGYSSHISADDVVCGVLGCNTPLVIRRGSDGDRIIGFCLVGGYHRGEAITELEEGKYDRTTFRFV